MAAYRTKHGHYTMHGPEFGTGIYGPARRQRKPLRDAVRSLLARCSANGTRHGAKG